MSIRNNFVQVSIFKKSITSPESVSDAGLLRLSLPPWQTPETDRDQRSDQPRIGKNSPDSRGENLE